MSFIILDINIRYFYIGLDKNVNSASFPAKNRNAKYIICSFQTSILLQLNSFQLSAKISKF